MDATSLFKYSGEDVFDLMFDHEGVNIKFELPENYNDPYELFLTIDFQDSYERLAHFQEYVNELPQYPVTCFSTSPSITPMWAHYGKNSSGFVIELDASEVKSYLGSRLLGLNKIDYQDTPRDVLNQHFDMAMYRCKPRDVYMLQKAVLYSAYFTKHTCWSYENECRLIASIPPLENGQLIDKFPLTCLKSIIIGPNASEELTQKALDFCNTNSVTFYKSILGKRKGVPYFLTDDDSYYFDEVDIVKAQCKCQKCMEPIESGKLCIWCNQVDSEQIRAASSNPYRILHDAGILEKYIEGMNKIGK